jgi:hypothetical protein
MPLQLAILLTLVVVAGCKPTGPPSTHTTSTQFPTLASKAAFLHQYVTFRRTYETLDFDIAYQNNEAGLVPGPSDWDIRLIATVPAAELAAWIPPGHTHPTTAPSNFDWLKSIPTDLDPSTLNEWYTNGQTTIGLDRQRRIVASRFSTNSP